MDQRAILDHQFVVAAYAITWILQLGYVAWLGLKWRSQKRAATRSANNNPK
jgi:CcmD family protein